MLTSPSLIAVLMILGPFVWQSGTYEPFANPYSYVANPSCKSIANNCSWTNLTNVVYIDQPVTTGFSRGNITVNSEEDVAKQFKGFWKNFVNTFKMQGFKVYSQSLSTWSQREYREIPKTVNNREISYRRELCRNVRPIHCLRHA